MESDFLTMSIERKQKIDIYLASSKFTISLGKMILIQAGMRITDE